MRPSVPSPLEHPLLPRKRLENQLFCDGTHFSQDALFNHVPSRQKTWTVLTITQAHSLLACVHTCVWLRACLHRSS